MKLLHYFQGRDSTDEELATQVKQLLHVQDETFLPSDTDTGSTGSSSDEKSNKKKSKLNGFLEECNIEPLTKRVRKLDNATPNALAMLYAMSYQYCTLVIAMIYGIK